MMYIDAVELVKSFAAATPDTSDGSSFSFRQVVDIILSCSKPQDPPMCSCMVVSTDGRFLGCRRDLEEIGEIKPTWLNCRDS